MGYFLSKYYKTYGLPTGDCWDEIFISPSNIIKPAYSKESYNTDRYIYDYYHIRNGSIHTGKDHGIDILNSY